MTGVVHNMTWADVSYETFELLSYSCERRALDMALEVRMGSKCCGVRWLSFQKSISLKAANNYYNVDVNSY